MIDTHSHLLPGLDDGAENIEESLALALAAEGEGITDIVCTPHVDSFGDRAARLGPGVLEATQSALREAGLALRLHLGYELTFPFVQTLAPTELSPLCLGVGNEAILLEAPYVGWPAFAEDFFFKLRLQGLTPVLAHPERNPTVQRRPDLLSSLVRLGVVPQGTVPSLFGVFGAAARKTLLRRLVAGDIWLIASDAHYRRRTECSMSGARTKLARALPGIDVQLLFEENPTRLLRGESLLSPEPIRGKGGAWSHIRSVLGERKSL